MRALWLVVLAIPMALQVAAPALGEHPTDRLDAAWAHADRQVVVEKADRFGFQATSSLPDGSQRIAAAFDALDGRLRLSFQPPDANGSVVDLALDLHALVEFEDLDGDGRFSLGDPVLQQVRMEGLRYVDVEVTRAEGLHNITYRYPLAPAFTGHLFVSFLLPANATAVGNRSTAAVHVEHHLRDFAFQEAGSHVALHTRVENSLGVEVTAGAVAGADERHVGLYTWAPQAQGSAPTGVTAQPYGEEGEAIVVFAYGHDASVRHGLSLGFQRIVPLPPPTPLPVSTQATHHVIEGELRVYLPALVLAVGAMAGTVYWRLRVAPRRAQ